MENKLPIMKLFWGLIGCILNLSMLDLTDTNIYKKTSMALYDLIVSCKKMSCLDLSCCWLHPMGLEWVLDGLEKTQNMQLLRIHDEVNCFEEDKDSYTVHVAGLKSIYKRMESGSLTLLDIDFGDNAGM